MDPTSAGWYPDPSDRSQERWFDGQQWSQEHVRAAAQAEQAPPPPPAAPQEQAGGQQAPSYAAAEGQPGQQQGAPPTYPAASPYGQQPPSYPQQGAGNSGRIMAIIGIVCGLIAFVFCPPGFGIAGMVLGGLAIGKQEKNLGIAAIVVSVIGLVVGIAFGAFVATHMHH